MKKLFLMLIMMLCLTSCAELGPETVGVSITTPYVYYEYHPSYYNYRYYRPRTVIVAPPRRFARPPHHQTHRH